jgi:hypothetical protein
LHHLIIAASLEDDSYFTRLGAFVSAGYQLLPQRDILYDLQTPHLSYLGMFLKDKHLIITGSVGDRVGYLMRGSLTNEGVARFSFGDAMMGRLTNAGTMEHGGGNDMIGILRNTGTAGNLGDMMIGVLEDNGTSSTRGRIMLGNNCGSWNIPEHNRASFLIDILDQSQDYSKRRNSFRENYGWGR